LCGLPAIAAIDAEALQVGNQRIHLGAAVNLSDDNWLYGSSADDIRYTLVNGRNGVMPAHGELLGENRTKILAAYVYSLAGGE
jgi:cytochrome c oxidase cbb3-type subunit 3